MIGLSNRRQRGRLLAKFGRVCLGAGGLVTSGCTTTVSDLYSAATPQQAKKSKSDSRLASSDAAGRAHITDLDEKSRMAMRAGAGGGDSFARADSKMVRSSGRIPTMPYAPMPGQQVAAARPAPEAPAVPNFGASEPRTSRPADTTRSVVSGKRQPAPATRAQLAAAAKQKAAKPPVITPAGSANQPAAVGSEPIVADAVPAAEPAAPALADAIEPQPQIVPTAAQRPTGGLVPGRPVVRSKKTQWQPASDGKVLANNHERKRADLLMKRAHTMLENGYREEALRLASVAEQLELSHQSVYRIGEERPSAFVAQLRNLIDPTGIGAAQHSIAEGTTATQPSRAGVRHASTKVEELAGPAGAAPIIAAGTGSDTATRQTRTGRRSILIRPNGGAKSGERKEPRFASTDNLNSCSKANAGQLEVPVQPAAAPRADDRVALADSSSAALAPEGTADETLPAVTTIETEIAQSDEPAVNSPVPIKHHFAFGATGAMAESADEAEIEPALDGDAPAAAPPRFSQLTIASLAGLLTGIAGLIGIAWWRRQERRHYAGN